MLDIEFVIKVIFIIYNKLIERNNKHVVQLLEKRPGLLALLQNPQPLAEHVSLEHASSKDQFSPHCCLQKDG